MNKDFLLLALLPVFMSACSIKDNSGFTPAQPSVVPEATASMEEWEKNDSISSLDFIEAETDDCKYVFLQSDDTKSIIGCINRIFVSDSVFTVVDESVTQK